MQKQAEENTQVGFNTLMEEMESVTSNSSKPGKVEVGEVATENSTRNGEKGDYSNPIIPKGFKAIETAQDATISSDADWNSPTGYQHGLVIEDATGDSQTNGSQFVWVPVPRYEDFHSLEGYRNGSLDSKLSNCKEAGDKNSSSKTQESIEMYESIKINGGFYVARFEAGISPNMPQAKPTADTTATYGDGTYKPVSKQNTYVWNWIQWGGTSVHEATDGMQGNDKTNGAVKVARSMYNSIEEGNKNTNTTVKSTLIYGVQWDAIMNFIDPNYITGTCDTNSFVRDSTGKGNYQDSDSNNNPARAGDTNYTAYSQKNIYDIAGNVFEWTFEAGSSDIRVNRGGSFYSPGASYPASIRVDNRPNIKDINLGLRVALYL